MLDKPTSPTADESTPLLKAAGWRMGDVGTATGWLLTGRNGEHVIETRASSQAKAWWQAVEHARTLGLLGSGEDDAEILSDLADLLAPDRVLARQEGKR